MTAYGSTAAWSRKAPDGTYRLVVRTGGVTSDANVAASPEPVRPRPGPELGERAHRRLQPLRDRLGDPWLRRVRLQRRHPDRSARSRAISGARTSESAPSYFKGNIAFARRGNGRDGLYLYRPGRGTKRISSAHAGRDGHRGDAGRVAVRAERRVASRPSCG